MATDNIQIHATIHGRVQGVSFRYHTQHVANSLGITGWVRNLPDGTVEVLGEGTKDQLQDFTTFLRKGHPPARVDSIDLSEDKASGDYHTFDITYLAR